MIKKEGIEKSYRSNGQLWDEVNYINDKKENIENILWEEVNYINDIQQ
jgi:hypothetical protein